MKLKRLTAAIIAAATAIMPISLISRDLPITSTVFAVDTNDVYELPEWVPTDFESAVEFRNTYGATHIDNGLICIVYPDRVRKGVSEDTNGFELNVAEGMGRELKHEIYTHEYTQTCFNVFVYQPQKQGDLELRIVDTRVKSAEDDKPVEPSIVSEYSFSVDKNLNITENDIFSWLPDSTKEFSEYVQKNGEVSVKDNYVVFCTVSIEQIGDRWEPDSNNKYECFKYLISSNCTMEVRDMYVDGSYDRIYVYQAVKDGNEKLSWTRTSSIRPNSDEPTSYTLTADCAVLDNAQTILLPGQVKVTLVDADTNEPIIYRNDIDNEFRYILFRECDLGDGYVENPAVTGLKTNPSVIKYADLSKDHEYTFHLEQTDKIKNYSIIRDESSTVRKANNSYEVAFKLKYTPTGDVNDDGEFNVADIVLLQKWLRAVPDTEMKNWKAADFCNDNVLNSFDLCLMKKALIQAIDIPIEVTVREGGGVVGADIRYKVYSEDENYYLFYQDLTYDQEPQSIVIPIKEQDYHEIMSQAYTNYLESVNIPKEWSEIDFEITLNYADGSQKKLSSDIFPSVLTKLRKLLDEYKYSYNSYVEPDEKFEFGVPFRVAVDGLKLYLGPDERYEVVASIPEDTRLIEKGLQKNNNTWLFTNYNGQCGWINTLDTEGNKVIYFEEAARKPVIYLYPENETDVHIDLELTEAELHTTYPKYNNGWDVVAYPDGTLLNKADGSHHRYLFWDAVNCRTRFDFSKGFCVAGSDTESFLKEKLIYMGLTEEEMNEFIVYWLPLMEHNAYNLISFQGDVYTNSAKLNISPTPDSECRIFMAYVPLDNAVEIEPQQLETFERKGFSVVEWGGTEIKS